MIFESIASTMKIMRWVGLFLIFGISARADTPPPVSIRQVVQIVNVLNSPFAVPVQANYYIACDATAGPVAIYLPLTGTQNSGADVDMKKIDSTTNTCTLYTQGSDTMDGLAAYPIAKQFNNVTVVSSGGNNAWYVR
jgi:hypothetical protein